MDRWKLENGIFRARARNKRVLSKLSKCGHVSFMYFCIFIIQYVRTCATKPVLLNERILVRFLFSIFHPS